MNKNLIIGVFGWYDDPKQVMPWVNSAIRNTDENTHVVLIGVRPGKNLSEYLVEVEKQHQKKFFFLTDTDQEFEELSNKGQIHMLRFSYLTRFLTTPGYRYGMVITTDVRDVVFQSNPFSRLDSLMYRHGVPFVASSECIRIKNEDWNGSNIKKCFGFDVYHRLETHPVLNVGILSGTQQAVASICSTVYQLSLNRSDWVADQAAYNFLIHTNESLFLDRVYISSLNDGYSINAHVTSKPDEVSRFRPYLTCEPPYFDAAVGEVKNSEGMTFSILHQYDRVPEWDQYFRNLYG